MSHLFSPLTLKSVTLKNRIVVSPMCQYSATDGYASNWHLVHLGSRAVGGAGLVFTEATAVSPEGRISPEDLGIWQDGHIEMLQEITRFISEQGAVPAIQLAHAGRKGSTYAEWRGKGKVAVGNGGWQPVAPSAVAFEEDYALPLETDHTAIDRVIGTFAAAAERALRAGFKAIELHAAHGYLIHEFLSPLSNLRTDDYGGSRENRARLLLEVLAGVQEVWPADLPIFVRISATDWAAQGGWTLDDSVWLAGQLQRAGVDVLDVSTGGLVPDVTIPVGAGYQLPFASRIKKEVSGLVVGTVGLITNAAQAETLLTNGDADLVFMARELLRHPYFPLQAAKEVHSDIEWPNQYRRAR